MPAATDKDTSRASRSASTRETETRRKPWAPPSMLDAPPPRPGMKQRWIRAESQGDADKLNMGKRIREGYQPRRADTVENFEVPTIDNGQHAGLIGVGGLILAEIPEETANERKKYYQQQTDEQLQAIDNELMKHSNPAMPMDRPHRRTQVEFGNPENKGGSQGSGD